MTISGPCIPPTAEVVYRLLVRNGPMTPEELGAAGAEGDVKASVQALEEVALVDWLDGKAVPRPPFPALEAIAARRAREAAEARDLAESLSDLWSEHARRESYLEFLETEDACQEAQKVLLDGAVDEVCALSIGPVGDAASRPTPTVVPGFFESIGRGVRYRVVYGVSVLREPLALAAARTCMEAGEQARVCPDVPVNLTIADRKLALVSVPGGSQRRRDVIVVRPSGLLDVLVSIFESHWRIGTPLRTDPGSLAGEPDEGWRDLLSLLAAGLTDDAIARELGVSERTVGRRVARLEEILGAASRFQLGLQAARHGWL
ncbi:LuxR family transcriptional regulator [Nocardioides humilatus]|uniref:LuxR family transcriptional regulator n=1 Tax=Nocardioides humilatus TaxID=2607660 RepID=A0A5B1LE91_9ACTN|nr:LuxR C-terminal-related transcriptional regulator [Nocardioides humilatus]KAA1418624.1 LuxR family transcriptional regulator [Nocardioides humilatus]